MDLDYQESEDLLHERAKRCRLESEQKDLFLLLKLACMT